jgi:serine/threonine-protein kinase HipA
MNALPPRELVASINGVEVGVLRDEANIWSFEYTAEWGSATSSYDLAPNLPRTAGKIVDGATTRPVQWFFDNLLPEEGARDLLAREAKIPGSDSFGLLAYYGKESAGSITLLNRGEVPEEPGYVPLPDTELHERIAKLPQQSLVAGAPKHMSNAGAQHKLAVCVRNGELFHPKGNMPSTHLLKPDHPDNTTWPSTVANEYFVMKLAAALDLPVPPVQIRHVPDPVYLINRFDRESAGNETRRLHVIDACQLLGLDRTFKYQQSSVATLVACIERCNRPALARHQLLRWVIFNLLTANADAHLKNLSFRVSANGIELAPFYDLVSTECYRADPESEPRWPERPLSLLIGNANTFGAVTPADVLAFAAELGTNRRAAERALGELTGAIGAAADTILADFEGLIIPAATRAAQLRVMWKIRHIAIRDMLDRLSGNRRI